jgi:FkbM family methyltransferase
MRERERKSRKYKITFLLDKTKEILHIIKSIWKHPLNKHQKFLAILNFLKYNIAKLLIKKKEIIVPWIADSKFIIGINEIQLRWNIYWGIVEYEDMIFTINLLNKENLFIDVGANVGIYTILASKVVGARSIAFEPCQKTFERFKDQISINRIDHLVTVHQNAVGSKSGNVHISNYGDTRNVLNEILKVNEGNQESIEVKMTTLDDEIKNENRNYVIKIDVEGYEFEVIRGAKNILSSKKLIALIVENNDMSKKYDYSRLQMHEYLLSLNLFPIKYDPFTKKITKKENITTSLNTIYINDFLKIQKICEGSNKYFVHTANIWI